MQIKCPYFELCDLVICFEGVANVPISAYKHILWPVSIILVGPSHLYIVSMFRQQPHTQVHKITISTSTVWRTIHSAEDKGKDLLKADLVHCRVDVMEDQA